MNTAVRPYEVLAHSHLSTIVEGNEFTHGRPVREKERLPAELLFGKRRNSLHNKRRTGRAAAPSRLPRLQPHNHTLIPSRFPPLQPHTHPQGPEERTLHQGYHAYNHTLIHRVPRNENQQICVLVRVSLALCALVLGLFYTNEPRKSYSSGGPWGSDDSNRRTKASV